MQKGQADRFDANQCHPSVIVEPKKKAPFLTDRRLKPDGSSQSAARAPQSAAKATGRENSSRYPMPHAKRSVTNNEPRPVVAERFARRYEGRTHPPKKAEANRKKERKWTAVAPPPRVPPERTTGRRYAPIHTPGRTRLAAMPDPVEDRPAFPRDIPSRPEARLPRCYGAGHILVLRPQAQGRPLTA